MKLLHFERLHPLCPCCKGALAIGPVLREIAGDILEGRLLCTNPGCLGEYPILDGIPLLVSNLREYVSQNILSITARRDLSPAIESLLGDCCGMNSAFYQVHYHLGIYAFDHYADLDPDEENSSQAGSCVQLLDLGLSLLKQKPDGPVIDTGCSVGRTTFALAARCVPEIILGADLNYSMVRLASDVLRCNVVRYPKRRIGVAFDRREFAADLPHKEKVDFWVCDALNLPFPKDTFALATSINLLDCVSNPYEHLRSLAFCARSGGHVLLSTPYDWSQLVTPIESWIGGHSQRAPHAGSGDRQLRSLLAGGAHPSAIQELALISEIEAADWSLRLHDRSMMKYRVHLILTEVRKPGSPE